MPTSTPQQSGRTVPLEVLSLGLSRTGTKSMQQALIRLGYKHTYHGFDAFDHPEDMLFWEEALDAKYFGKGKPYGREEWDRYLGHCAATTDMPAAVFWEELLDAYPEAKVILVQRDADKWYASFDRLVTPLWSPTAAVISLLLSASGGPNNIRALRKMVLGFFRAASPAELRRNAPAAYSRHYERIRAAVPRERLLEYRLGSGWGPLCEFLGREEPREEFPWLNEGRAMKEKVAEIRRNNWRAAGRSSVVPAVVVVAVAALGYWYRWR